MTNPEPRLPRPRRRPHLHDRRVIAMLKRGGDGPGKGEAGPEPDFADLACLLRAHREKAAKVIDYQLAGDAEMARTMAKFCRLLEDQIQWPSSWAEAAKTEREWRGTWRRLFG